MKKVRITWPKNEYISRQTFGNSMIWGNYEFTFEDIETADYWIIVNNYSWPKGYTLISHANLKNHFNFSNF